LKTTTNSDIKELKDLIIGLDKKLDRTQFDLEKKIDSIDKKIEVLGEKISGEIKALDIKVDSIDRRLDKVEISQKNQIWALIGILGTVVLATVIRFVLSALPNS
jgi:SMC interacting uncharacterized protein involved in chromosome segregation